MSESESAITESQEAPAATEKEDITYQAVEKDGVVTAIWEMKGRKHLRTIDPRSRQGREILNLYTTEDVEHPAASAAVTSSLIFSSSSLGFDHSRTSGTANLASTASTSIQDSR